MGENNWVKNIHKKCDVFLGDIFLKRNICVVGGFFCNKRLAKRKQFLAGRGFTEEAFTETSSSMLTREDDYGKHVLFFVVFAPSPTPLNPLVQTSSSTKCLQQMVCKMELSRGKYAAIAFRETEV